MRALGRLTGRITPGARGGGGRSVRFRLLAIALLPTLVILPLLLGVTIQRWNAKFDATLISKVNGDLTIAHQYLARIVENTGEQVAAFGASARLRDALAGSAEGGRDLGPMLAGMRAALGLDFLHMVDSRGIVRAAAPAMKGAAPDAGGPVVAAARAGRTAAAIDVLSGDELARIDPALAARARIDLVPTANAVPTERSVETRGMIVHAAAPAGDEGLVLAGGVLLNQNLVFIDTINDLVYREASLPEGSQGTATLFLEDVRISTNVRLFEGRRALGTRVSAVVRDAVLDNGRTWLDSAFVVNDWYISAYEPILDSRGERVGMLYVGFLEAPFTQAKTATLGVIALAFVAITAASVPIFLGWARAIFRPLERMTRTIARVEAGDLAARTGHSDGGDEIGRVALHLDNLLDRLAARERELRAWNEELNARVEERTRELRLANHRLEATTKQLVMSEKLAAIGEITAGVAHEIINPLAVMQGNLEVVRGAMGERAGLAGTEFRLMDEQIQRIGQIVAKLLQFAKPEEYAASAEQHAPGDVVADIVPLVQHLLTRSGVELRCDDRATRRLLMNRVELQQVLVNLAVNAIHAMPDGGVLTVSTRDEDRDGRAGLVIEVADTGCGIAPEVIGRVFDPFFTTKAREGTGLGLSISQTLVARQGGRITVASVPGEGSSFAVWLPEAA